jgi:hypothetical protein
MTKLGRRSRTSVLAATALAAATVLTGNSAPLAGESFLIPGVALSDADFAVGGWCHYLVVDEIMGESDSTTVMVAVTGRTQTSRGEAYWVELDSGPAGAPRSERETAKALILSSIKDISPGDSLGEFIPELYIRKGEGVAEQADPGDIERLNLSNPTSDSSWTDTAGVTVQTPNGRLICDQKHLVVEDKREIPMGSVTLVKNDADVYDIWFSEEVPVFHLVKSVIERVRDSRTVPAIPGIPDKGREVTRTTVELLGYGFDATSRLDVP